MRKFVASLVLLAAMGVFVSGCFKEESSEEAAVEKAAEKTVEAVEAVEKPAAPKDHPAH